MHGIIEALVLLPNESIVEVYTSAPWGLSKIKNKDGSYKNPSDNTTNHDLAQHIKDLIIENQLSVTFFVNKPLTYEKTARPENKSPYLNLSFKDREDLYQTLVNRAKAYNMSVEALSMKILKEYTNKPSKL